MTVAEFIDQFGRKVRPNRGGWLLCCLFPDHQDDTPSLSVAEDGRYYCWGCHKKGTFARLLHDFAGWSWHKAIAQSDLYAREFRPGESKTAVTGFTASGEVMHTFFSRGQLGLYDVDWEEGFERYLNEEDRLRHQPEAPRAAWAFPFVKGFLPQTLTHFEAGFDTDLLRVTIPIFGAGPKLHGFIGRSCVDDPRKYLVYPGTQPSKLVYNLHAVEGPDVLLVEGAWDVWMLHQLGFPHAAALMTSRISSEQADVVLRSGKRVIILFDNDKAGREGAMQVASVLLTGGARIDVVKLPSTMTDLKQVPVDVLRAALADRRPYPAPSAMF